MPHNKENNVEDSVVETAKSVNDGTNKAFNALNAVNTTEDAPMSAVDRTANVINKLFVP